MDFHHLPIFGSLIRRATQPRIFNFHYFTASVGLLSRGLQWGIFPTKYVAKTVVGPNSFCYNLEVAGGVIN